MSVKRHQVYKCLVCGIVTEILDAGAGEPVCCGQVMALQIEKTSDPAAGEKHVPVVMIDLEGVRVVVGNTRHPMDARHHIQWIEAASGDWTMRRYLNPGDPPEAKFPFLREGLTVRAFCNLHGLWQA